jgi:hypothetical protein
MFPIILDNDKETYKRCLELKVEYGDAFELVALQPVVDRNH